MRIPFSLRMQMYLASHPRAANRILKRIGERRLQSIGRRGAIRSAQQAYANVPFYRQLYEQHGMTAGSMRRLTWEQFQQLPTVNKELTESIAETDLLDPRPGLPRQDALIGLSSGTTRAPIHWPLGWSEFYITRSAFEATLRSLGAAEGRRTAVILMTAVEGGDQSGNMPYRGFFSLKEHYGWDMEVVATGEQKEIVHNWLVWFAQQGFTALFLISFPGTLERFLDYEQSLPAEERVPWSAFARKHILLGGQLVARTMRDRLRRETHLDPAALHSEGIIYVSSDTGQLMARATPFTIWLERYLDEHPEIAGQINLPLDLRDKPMLEFLPPMSILFEFDQPDGLTVTLWKHRPLIRYTVGDLVWAPKEPMTRLLDRAAPRWRQAFFQAGGTAAEIPRTTVGVVIGRADDICIVNGANVSPSIVRSALEAAGIASTIHHFKHGNNPADPNRYVLALELEDEQDDAARHLLATQWHDPLLEALLQVPAASDLAAAHRTTPITFELRVRSRGTEEFQATRRGKVTFTLPQDQLRSTH